MISCRVDEPLTLLAAGVCSCCISSRSQSTDRWPSVAHFQNRTWMGRVFCKPRITLST